MTAMPRFLLVFVGLLALAFGLELTPWAQVFLVTPWTRRRRAFFGRADADVRRVDHDDRQCHRDDAQRFRRRDRGGLQRRRGDTAHLYVWQALIRFDVLIVWVIWVRIAGRRASLPNDALPA
jgi:hypothetical protein